MKSEVVQSDKIRENNAGVVSIIFGIFSIVMTIGTLFLGFAGGLICGIIGLIFALVQRKISKNKWSTWGLWLSVIGILLNIFVLIWFATAITAFIKQVQELQASGTLNQATNTQSLYPQ